MQQELLIEAVLLRHADHYFHNISVSEGYFLPSIRRVEESSEYRGCLLA